ncbi:MAG: 6-phosphogluconolactonase [Bryobacterales bacterium]|nr:6-phosphogluconolactonase [Bryobacterales bacterium]
MTVVESCAERLIELLSVPGSKSFAISGGSSPKPLFALLARSAVDWREVRLYWVDERCVPADDDQSNYRMAREHLIEPADIPASNVHRVQTELPPEQAAEAYARQLPDRLDVIHLGMGSDAHTASLFPGDRLIEDRTRRTAATYVEKFKQWRVTLCPRVILEAGNVVVFAPGGDKADALQHVRHGEIDPLRYPAQIARLRDRVDWFTG